MGKVWTTECLETESAYRQRKKDHISLRKMEEDYRARKMKIDFTRMNDAQKSEYFRKKYKTKGI